MDNCSDAPAHSCQSRNQALHVYAVSSTDMPHNVINRSSHGRCKRCEILFESECKSVQETTTTLGKSWTARQRITSRGLSCFDCSRTCGRGPSSVLDSRYDRRQLDADAELTLPHIHEVTLRLHLSGILWERLGAFVKILAEMIRALQ